MASGPRPSSSATVTTATCTSARKASRSAGVIARDMIHRLALRALSREDAPPSGLEPLTLRLKIDTFCHYLSSPVLLVQPAFRRPSVLCGHPCEPVFHGRRHG